MSELNITGREGDIRILEIPKWGMAKNLLGTTEVRSGSNAGA